GPEPPREDRLPRGRPAPRSARRAAPLARLEHVQDLADERVAPAARAARLVAREGVQRVAHEQRRHLVGHGGRFSASAWIPPRGTQIAEIALTLSEVGLEPLVIIRTIPGGETDTVPAGTLAGAGCFRCDSCGYAVALQELDEVPACPHCGAADSRRSSMFGELSMAEATGDRDPEHEWLDEAREALVTSADYLAYAA